MTMSWSIGAQKITHEDRKGTWRKGKQERKGGRGGKRMKNRSEIPKYTSERLLKTELRNNKKEL